MKITTQSDIEELISLLISNDDVAIHDFFFVRCYDTFTYIGQYFCDGMTAEEIIGEAYEVLSADDWHKLRIFKYSSSLVTYVSVIIARHFQHKRDRNEATDDEALVRLGGKSENESSASFLLNDINNTLSHFNALDQILIQRILLEGEKPRDVIDEIRELILAEEGDAFISEHTPKQLFGYVYTRYSRARAKFQNYMRGYGYGE